MDLFIPFLLAIAAWLIFSFLTRPRRSNAPVLGSTGLLGYWTALQTFTRTPQQMLEGYKKFNKRPFLIPRLKGWTLYISGEQYDEVRHLRDTQLSMPEWVRDTLCLQYTIGQAVDRDQWHVPVIRKRMTQALSDKFPEVWEEIQAALSEELGLAESGDEKAVKAHNLILQIICRASNRLFVGLPLCRNAQYTKISRAFTGTVISSGILISLFPDVLKPLVGRWMSRAPGAVRAFEGYLRPMMEERWRLQEESGVQKPDDMLQWLMDASPRKRDSSDITARILAVNFAAMHTTSLSFTHVLYLLAAHPEHAPALREEALRVSGEQGWTKDALGQMWKMDSFVREAMRVGGLSATGMGRKAVADVMLSDGTTVPRGTEILVNLWGVHHDPELFADPWEFRPWRYSERIENGASELGNAFSTPSSELLLWGGGAHVCAGRFLAALEMKAVLAAIVLSYEVRFEDALGLKAGERPADVWFGNTCIPNNGARVVFTRRK